MARRIVKAEIVQCPEDGSLLTYVPNDCGIVDCDSCGGSFYEWDCPRYDSSKE